MISPMLLCRSLFLVKPLTIPLDTLISFLIFLRQASTAKLSLSFKSDGSPISSIPIQSAQSLLPSTLPTVTSEVLLQPHPPATGVVSVAAAFQSSAASPMGRPLPAVSLLTSPTLMILRGSSVWDPTLSKPSRRGSPDYIKRACLRPVIFTLSPWFLHPRTLVDLPCQGVFFSRLDALH